MDQLNLSTEGMTDAEQMLLSMIFSFASDQLTRTWTIQQGGPSDVVIYDLANPRARVAWERHRQDAHPISVVLSEDPIPDLPWVLQKPVRTQHLIPFLNGLSDWMAQHHTATAATAAAPPSADPFDTLKQRLGAVASSRLSQAGALQDLKLIISGSVAAGKSTAIRTISDIPPINTDVPATDAVSFLKARTTVALDYGELTLADGKKLRLYGTPGQRRYDFMSKILSRGALGLVVLIDNRVDNPLAELDYYASMFTDLVNESAMVVGVTHRDQAPEPGLDRYERRLQTFHKPWPVFPVDPRKKADVIAVFDALVTMLEHSRGPYAVAGRP
ncbi:MAG: ATP/GTP-binding protein [Nitrospira sp.]|nr:ATP/GTP-binding protein [Nitrospira sp.]